MEVNKVQYAQLVDFLKRWGIRSPMLLSEMADHYSEIAGEKLANGYSWEKVLNGFKKKKNYLHFRRIQDNYELLLKKQRKNLFWRELGVVFTMHYGLPVLAVIVVLHFSFIYINPQTAASGLSILTIAAIGVYVFFAVRYRKMFNIIHAGYFAPFLIMNYAAYFNFIRKVDWDQELPVEFLSGKDLLLTFAFTMVVIVDIHAWRLWRSEWRAMTALPEEVVKVLKD